MKDKHYAHVLELGLATLFISTSGALGRYIDMPTPVIIWWRSALALLFLFLYCHWKNIDLNIKSKRDMRGFILSALFLGAHWITYFYSLKLSNVAIGMLSLHTFPIITTLLEPLFVRVKLDPVHIFLGIMVLFGIYLLAPEFDLDSSQVQGILLGILSALCYALRILILKRYVSHYNGTMLMLYQLIILAIVLSPVLALMDTTGIKSQYPYVFLLALLTTAIGHTMFVKSLKYFSASSATIISSTLPVFGIIIAYYFLNEVPKLNTILGGTLIVSTVVIEGIRSKNKNS